jgi:hypothetical protein
MADMGIQRAFARFGARLHNFQWSVSAWTPNGELVVSLWEHHYRLDSPSGTAEYSDRLDRWRGPGNAEFRQNLTRAFQERSPIRLVVASTRNVEHVQSGQDASKVKKSFNPRIDLAGELVLLEGEEYTFRFRRAATTA